MEPVTLKNGDRKVSDRYGVVQQWQWTIAHLWMNFPYQTFPFLCLYLYLSIYLSIYIYIYIYISISIYICIYIYIYIYVYIYRYISIYIYTYIYISRLSLYLYYMDDVQLASLSPGGSPRSGALFPMPWSPWYHLRPGDHQVIYG